MRVLVELMLVFVGLFGNEAPAGSGIEIWAIQDSTGSVRIAETTSSGSVSFNLIPGDWRFQVVEEGLPECSFTAEITEATFGTFKCSLVDTIYLPYVTQ